MVGVRQVDRTGRALTNAEAVALHTTTARFHLDQLEAAGLVGSDFQRRGVGRPRKVYRTLQPPLPSPDGARTPGAWLGKVGATLDPLHRWGYLPELRTGKGEPHTEVELQPLVAPGVCRATVTTRTVFDPTPGHGTHSDVPAVT